MNSSHVCGLQAQVVSLICKCSESNGESVQLGVVRALLTVTTAEHFVLHGDCLMQVLHIHIPVNNGRICMFVQWDVSGVRCTSQ